MTRRSAARSLYQSLCLAAALVFQALPAPAQDNSDAHAAHPLDWDWVELDQIPVDQRDVECENCGGQYVDPLADVDRSVPPDESDIDATAEKSELREDSVEFSGGVKIRQGYRRLSADRATLDRVHNSAEVEGDIVLREPGIFLEGDLAHLYSRTGEADIENSRFVLHEQHMRGTAAMLERDSDGILHVTDGDVTYCAPGHDEWMMKTRKLDLDLDEGLATARNAQIDLGGVPVFWSPWLQFPLDDRRRTGFLWPEFGSDTQGGVDISVPVYFNLAPNYDLLYAPRYIEERGLDHQARARFLHPLVGMWDVGGAYMAHDSKYKDDNPPGKSNDRWLAIVRQNGLFQQRWRSRVDYSKASDIDYMKDLDNSSLSTRRRTSLLQLGTLDYLGDSWLVNFELQQFQSLTDDIANDYKTLPQITANYRNDGTPFELQPLLLAQYSNFDSDNSNRVTGEREYTEAGVAFPMQWTYGFLTPTVKYRYLQYQLHDNGRFTNESPSTGAPLASLDSGLYFDRESSLGSKPVLQTIEPHLYYLYSAHENQQNQPIFDTAELTFTYNQLFRETRFSGHDRIDDANQVSVGLTSRLIDQTDGHELLAANLGQIFYFRDREVRPGANAPPMDTNHSEIAGQVAVTPIREFSLRGGMVWDPYDNQTDSATVVSSFMPGNGQIFNLSYSYRRPQTTVATDQPVANQANFSTYLPVTRHWRLFGALNYSFEANTSVEDMVGVEYDSCCWKLRMLYLRYYDTNNTLGLNPDYNDPQLQREHSVQLQFVLKGMGGVGNRTSGIMRDMIQGFTDSDY